MKHCGPIVEASPDDRNPATPIPQFDAEPAASTDTPCGRKEETRAMEKQFPQPDLAEMLQEPVVRLVMARDGVTREEVEDLIARVGARFAERHDDPAASATENLPPSGAR
jgi:hypothetical protein